ncbi:MAG: hypothetical protein Q9215_001441 [Flavoplaca cf. flavocitrina]
MQPERNPVTVHVVFPKCRNASGSDEDEFPACENHSIDDVYDERLTLNRVVDLEGNVLAQDLLLDENAIVQEDIFDRKLTMKDLRISLEMKPQVLLTGTVIRYLWRQGKVNLHDWMARLLNMDQPDVDDNFVLRDLNQLARSTIKHPHITSQEREEASSIEAPFPTNGPYLQMVASIVLEDLSLFQEALENNDISIPYLPTFRLIGLAMSKFKIETDHWTVNALLRQVTRFHDRINAIESLMEGFKPGSGSQPSLEPARWTDMQEPSKSYIKQALDTLQFVDRGDAICLAQLAFKDTDPLTVKSLIPLVQRFKCNTAFLTALANVLLTASIRGEGVEQSKASRTFDQLVEVLGPDFRIEYKIATKRSEPGDNPSCSSVQCLANAEDVDLLLHHMHSIVGTRYDHPIIERLISESESCHFSVFLPFYLQLLFKILSRLSSDPDYDCEHHTYRELVSKVLTSYIHRYVQLEPAVPHISVPDLGSCGEQRLGGALVITKKLSYEEKKHSEWKERLETARKRILGLDQPSLLALLGTENYNRITTSIDARMGSKLRKLRNKRHQANIAEVIDLTS